MVTPYIVCLLFLIPKLQTVHVLKAMTVWPDGYNISSIFGNLQNWKFAQKHKCCFFKWANPGPFLVYFRLFHMTQINLLNWKKRRWCAWDSNPGREDGRCRQIHWAMVALPCIRVVINEGTIFCWMLNKPSSKDLIFP